MNTTKESIFPNRLLGKLATAEAAYTLVRAREIVERVSPLVYGKLSIRQFRRDLFTGIFDEHLEPGEWEALEEAHALEATLLDKYAGMIGELARGYSMSMRMDMEDLKQEGGQAVLLAMYGYDGQTQMSTYFRHAIQRWMEDLRKYGKRRPHDSNFMDETIEVVAPEADEPEEVGNIDLMRQALAVVQSGLTPLERVVMELYPTEGWGCLSKAARQVINPKTLKPYTRASASNALQSALDKIARAYDNLLINAHRRVA